MFGRTSEGLGLAKVVIGCMLLSSPCGTLVYAGTSGNTAQASNDSQQPAEPPVASNLSGKWKGTWLSGSTGHKGPMQADFCSAGAGRWKVVFRGRFCALIPFQYSAILHESRSSDGTLKLSGSRNLGPLFGTFHFNGTVRNGQLDARWWSQKESGQFRLSR